MTFSTESSRQESNFQTEGGQTSKNAARAAVIAADRDYLEEVELAEVWAQLVGGVLVVRDGLFTEQRWVLVVAKRATPQGSLSGRRLRILELLLRGSEQKNIAVDLQLAPSTIAFNARIALEYLGVSGRPSRTHPMLMLAAIAAANPAARINASLSRVWSNGEEWLVLGVRRPDLVLLGVLPPAELHVARQLVEGRCHAEISSERQRAERTIANQLGVAFRRLNVSGRNALILRVFEMSGILDGAPQSTDRERRDETKLHESGVRRLSTLLSAHAGASPGMATP